VLKISNVDFSRGDNHILHDFSLLVEAGELVYVCGENGAGKTTLLKVLAGIIQPDAGDICWNQVPIIQQNPCLYIGHSSGLKDGLTVTENLEFYRSLDQFNGTANTAFVDSIQDALKLVGLAEYNEQLVANLSAGQKKRVALARLSLSNQPIFIIDEPLNALDHNSTLQLEQLIAKLCQQYRKLVLLSSHQELTHLQPNKTVVLSPC
jgi:heme exporter protein A